MDTRPTSNLTIGYVLRKFPVLSETFILEEILALESKGVPVQVFSLSRPSDPRFHENLARLKAPIFYVPDLTNAVALLRSSRRAAKRYKKRYFKTLAYVASRRRPMLLWRFLQAGHLALEARRRGVTHLHAHFATRATTVAQLTSQLSRIPYSFTAHAYDIFTEDVETRALRNKIKKAAFVRTISDFNKVYLDALSAGESSKIVRLYNGIDLTRFTPAPGRKADPFTFVCVARLVEKKGHRALVEACRLLRERGHQFQCWIVGKGALRSALEAMIKEHDLQDRVYLLGAHTHGEVLDRYREAHAYVLPCLVGKDGNRDGLPVSIVEALACGLPVVTTPVTGIPEVVKHQQNGLLVKENDASALADALESLMCNPSLYDNLRTRARESVAEQFDLRCSAETLVSLFQQFSR